MATALAILKLLLSLGPGLIAFIRQLEEVMPEAGKGAEKLAILKAYMEAAWEGLSGILPAFEDVWPKIQKIVGSIVAAFNALGIFKK